MSVDPVAVHEPRIVHSLPGRVRLELAGWSGERAHGLERRLRTLEGVRSASASPATRRVLVRFDTRATDTTRVVAGVRRLGIDRLAEGPTEAEDAPPPALVETTASAGAGGRPLRRARLSARGLDRDPDLARRVVE